MPVLEIVPRLPRSLIRTSVESERNFKAESDGAAAISLFFNIHEVINPLISGTQWRERTPSVEEKRNSNCLLKKIRRTAGLHIRIMACFSVLSMLNMDFKWRHS
ncbi:hypothetical protein CEXT_63781 [Caerostris extrusa]|uniref:Uncharacterized protein n=1 Tax=Caerostris extrusa TaxID=172846 RepID=A0AAV4QCG4_CAEEX|nr:hypothetical protein CEXT_63781 [Caerostris extrusa]